MKKTLLLLVAAIVLTAGPACASSYGQADSVILSSGKSFQANLGTLRLNSPSEIATPSSLSGRGSDFAVGLHQATSSASFAELGSTSKSFSVNPIWLLALVAAAVLVCRVFGIHLAKEMADHERETHRAKAQMYRSLTDR